MNKKGFTLVELITTFALAAVIITILINISVIIRDIYSKSEVRTRLLIEQADLSNVLNTRINKQNLEDYSACTDSSFCYNFTFSDGGTEKLIVNNTSIRFGNYTYKLLEGSEVKNPSISKEAVSVTSSDSEFLAIKIPITNKLYPNEDFGINLVYQYNLNYVTSNNDNNPTPDEFEQPEEPKNTIGKAATASNKTAAGKVPTGNFNTGDEYIINVDGTHEYHFYVLSTEGDKVNLIMSKNICSDGTLATETNTCTIAWVSEEDYDYIGAGNVEDPTNLGPVTAMNYLYEATKNWSNIENIKMDHTDEGNMYGEIKTTGNTTKIMMMDGIETARYENLKARMIKNSEIFGIECVGSTVGSCPAWMVNGLNSYISQYPTGTKEDISGISGYWSLDSIDPLLAIHIYSTGIGDTIEAFIMDVNGVRPVIEVLKSDLS